MKTILKISIFLTVIGAMMLTSCNDDLLNLEPKGKWHQGNFTDTTDVDLSVIAESKVLEAYAHMRDWSVTQFAFLGVTSIISDDADKGSTPSDAPVHKDFENFTMNASNSLVKDHYTGNFNGVSKANEALSLVASIPEENPKKPQLLGEALFLRAYYYFRLAQSFGGVPLVSTVLSPEDPVPARASINETYSFIEADLLEAINNLPDKDYYESEGGVGRATSSAAKGFLAKIYLYQSRWGDVIGLTSSIINSGVYDLSTPIDEIFTEKEENGSESLFEVQAESLEDQMATCEYAQIQGTRGALDHGWGFNVPSQKLVDAFEEGDPRRLTTVLYTGSTLPDGTIVPSVDEGSVNPYYNMKVHQWVSEINKAGRPERPFGGWINVRLLRYADIVLMHAEAANEMGDANDALEKLEWIRKRARNGNNNVLPQITTTDQTELRTKIHFERRIELAMEHERYFDLIRWGLAESVLGPDGWTAGKHEVLPIPQVEIDRANGTLVQNPGY